MTVSNTQARELYTCNGVTTVRTVPFRILDETHLRIVKYTIATGATEDLVLNTDYTVSDVGAANATFTTIGASSPYTSAVKLIAIRNVPLSQQEDYVDNDSFPAESHEEALDKVTMALQQHADILSRAAVFGEFAATNLSCILPTPAEGYGLVWDDDTGTLRNTTTSMATLEEQAEALFDIADEIVTVANIDSEVVTVAGIAANVSTVAGIAAAVSNVSSISAAVSGVSAISTQVTGVYNIRTNVTTVAGIATDVTAVANIDADVTTVAGLTSEISTVAGLASEIAALGPISASITTVAGIDTEVTTVAGIAADVSAVAAIPSAVSAVAAVDSEVVIVAGIDTEVSTVSGIAAAVSNVASISAAVSTVSGISANVTTVAGIQANVTTVAGISTAVSAVAAIASAVSAVAAIDDEVVDVAGIAAEVVIVANNLATITDAANNIPKANLSATSAPGVGDDTGDGYSEGSLWINVNSDTGYLCLDATLGAAVWLQVTTAAASLASLSDVNISSIGDKDFLVYDNASSKWRNRTPANARSDIGLGNVENTALSTWAGTTNITTLGTIATGVWSGTAISVVKGGTGLTTVAQGDLLYGSAADTWSKLAKDTNATRYLSNTGSSNNPAWAQVNLANGVTGVLDETNGGTGQSTITQGDILYGSAANTLSKLAAGTSGYYLKTQGAGANPVWAAVDSIAEQYLHVRDEKSTGTGGGDSATSTVTRVLNTVKTNGITGASLGSNQITLPAGTYRIHATAPAYSTGSGGDAGHRVTLYNVTDTAVTLYGTSEWIDVTTSIGTQTRSHLNGVFTIAGTKAFELRHFINWTETGGLGLAVSDGTAEVYGEVQIWKVG